MSTEMERDVDPQELPAGEQPPSELESALLSVALFGGLIIFTVGCQLLGWFG